MNKRQKRKQAELKKIAQQIYSSELILRNSKDQEEIKKATETIVRITNQVAGQNIEDLFELDDLIMSMMSKKN